MLLMYLEDIGGKIGFSCLAEKRPSARNVSRPDGDVVKLMQR